MNKTQQEIVNLVKAGWVLKVREEPEVKNGNNGWGGSQTGKISRKGWLETPENLAHELNQWQSKAVKMNVVDAILGWKKSDEVKIGNATITTFTR